MEHLGVELPAADLKEDLIKEAPLQDMELQVTQLLPVAPRITRDLTLTSWSSLRTSPAESQMSSCPRSRP